MFTKRTLIEILVLLAIFMYATTSYEYELIPAPGVVDMGNGVLLYTI
jgi:hypothetical protein